MRRLLIAALSLAASLPAQALDAACEPYVKAAEKSAAQPARHTVTQMDATTRVEAIKLDGVAYMQMDGEWMKMPASVLAAEKKINADVRSGAIKISQCKNLGRETIEGVATTVYSYVLDIPGLPKPKGEPAKAYIGDDGLVHAQSADGAKVRFRYSGVVAPKL